MSRQEKWDTRFLLLAETVAQWSKDPSTKCGAVIVRPDHSVASLGFNGFPKNMPDDPALYEDRDAKLSRIIHAEMNALLHAHGPVAGCTLYTWPLCCCDRCAAHMIQAGITRVVSPKCPPDKAERWAPILERGFRYFREANVLVTLV